MATMEREKLMLSQDITIMAMVAMDMVVIVTMAMAREKLKLMLSQDITTMVTLMDMAMAMDTMVMERGKPKPLLLLMPSQAIIIMATLMDMVTDMVTMDMERGKLMLPLAITMDMERGRPPPSIIVMILVDMIMALFIRFVTLSGICWNLLSGNTELYLKKSFFEIKRKKL